MTKRTNRVTRPHGIFLYDKPFVWIWMSFANLVSVVNPIDPFTSGSLQPKLKANTLAFRFYHLVYGLPYKIYEPELLASGRFRGKSPDQSFDLEFWRGISEKRGLHWFYHKLNTITRARLRRRYV